jgi:hypothetical protein
MFDKGSPTVDDALLRIIRALARRAARIDHDRASMRRRKRLLRRPDPFRSNYKAEHRPAENLSH